MRLYIAKILGRLFSVETLSLAMRFRPEVIRLDIVTTRDLEDMDRYFASHMRSKLTHDFAAGGVLDALLSNAEGRGSKDAIH